MTKPYITLTAQDISDLLSGKPSGKGFNAKCPAHEDRNPSLSINTGKDGRVLLHCHAGCSFESILEAIHITVADITPSREQPKRVKGKIVAVYDYLNSKGERSYQAVRYDPKDFRQRKPDGKGGWIWNMQGMESLPYHLPAVRAAVDRGEEVINVEGEKDADNLAKLGFTTTTNHGGALQWTDKHSRFLKGADVIIAPDNDEPDEPGKKPAGELRVELVIPSLRRAGVKRIRLLRIPAPHKDVSDWIEAGGTTEQFKQLIDQAVDRTLDLDEEDEEPFENAEPADAETYGDDNATITDLSNPDMRDLAHQFARDYGDGWAYDEPADTWRQWDNTHWKAVSDEATVLTETVETAIKSIAARVTSRSRIKDVLFSARGKCWRDFTPLANLINFINCTVDLETGDLRSHDKANNLTYCLPYPYEVGPLPLIQAALAGIIPDEAGQRAYKAHIGLALIGDRTFHKALILYGPKRSGKSTFLNLMLATCGHQPNSYAGPALFGPDMEGMHSRQSWHSHLLVAIDELPQTAMVERNEGRVKTMIAHGGVSMRGLYEREQLDNRWGPKLAMSTNDAPRYVDRSTALSERLIIIHCPNTLTDHQQDRQLLGKLLQELPQFAAACIQEAQRVIEAGEYPTSANMRDLKNDIEVQGDPLKSWMAEYVLLVPGAWEPTAKLYRDFNAYLNDNGYDPRERMSQQQFTRALKDGWQVTSTIQRTVNEQGEIRQARGLNGLRLITSGDPDLVTPVTECDAPDDAPVTDV